jgi:hypothetical protein
VTEHEDVDQCRNGRGEWQGEDDGEAAEQDSGDLKIHSDVAIRTEAVAVVIAGQAAFPPRRCGH